MYGGSYYGGTYYGGTFGARSTISPGVVFGLTLTEDFVFGAEDDQSETGAEGFVVGDDLSVLRVFGSTESA